ncbi:hypothetical protein D0Z07_1089 [Hyphodiscus hymeniophilus]|uniref:PXA domain-containing protein n=1 Tax=Hyphodiscus hymeniophilus TaxID=353542 RepID=A0A9P7B088_9HELO|nr:hypothetical protein D0Z07_1089 [Hyphodiscus hymeniophilus]
MNGTGGDSKLGGDDIVAANDAPPTESPESQARISTNVEDLTTKTLQFLGTASPETLGALGGVVLHATWEGQSSASTEDLRREKGLDIVKRILDLRDRAAKDEEADAENELGADDFEGFQPETAAALNDLVDAVVRDYVKWWYSPIIPKDQSFPLASRLTLTKFLISVSLHLSRKRPADSFLDFLTNSTSTIIVFLGELSSALSVCQGSAIPPAEAVYTYLSSNPESNLANILNQKQQSKKFKMIAEDILENFLEKSAYSCEPARVFLREIFAGIILEMTLQSCSKPEWINDWIVYMLEDGEPDISQAIDSGVNAGTDPFMGIDGDVGNIGLAKTPKPQTKKQEEKRHKKRLSKAEEAMEEAMEEAKRLSQLIANEDAKRLRVESPIPTEGTSGPVSMPVEKSAEALSVKTAMAKEATAPQTPIAEARPLTPRDVNEPASTVPIAGARTPTEVPQNPSIHDNTEMSASPNPLKTPTTQTSPQSGTAFTNFDQILPQSTPAALTESPSLPRRKTLILTLHNANVIIYDDSGPADKGKMRTKPTGDYMVQIEPSSSDFPGWMIMRRYSDFETLHEVLRRIANISGVRAFTEQHNALPNWKEHTKASLRGELERYLRDACWYQTLAESEGMKRFLEREQGQSNGNSKSGFPGIGWPTPSAFENMGKGMLDVLTSAPKGVAEGGKAIGGGITGVFNNIGNLGQKKPNGSSSSVGMHTAGRSSTSVLPRMDSNSSITTIPRTDSMAPLSGTRKGRASEDSLRATPLVATQPSKIAPMERRPSYNSVTEDENDREARVSSARSSISGRRSATISREPSRAPPSRRSTPLSSPIPGNMEEMRLPPPPSDITDDYGTHFEDSSQSRGDSSAPTTRTSTSTAPSQQSPGRPSLSNARRPSVPVAQTPRKHRKEATPLTEPETRVAVELMFAVINELYTLSSAWNIRRTLLNAAKTFLLRPGNPSLTSIQNLIQESVIAANTSDTGIAAHLRRLRENTLPTEEELKTWPAEMSMEEKERLRIKARKLLVERGVPTALTGVMGQAATGEAMGRIFDCLQVEEVARGLIFGLLLQGVRAVAH